MQILLRDSELELGRFGEFLLRSRIVAEKYARYYVGWVRKFLQQVPEKEGVTVEDRITIFLDILRPQVEDWQLDQAEKAVRLYFSNYLNGAGVAQTVSEIRPDDSGRFKKAEVLDAVRRLIRLRHYSPRTEQTYAEWLERFFRYLTDRDKSSPDVGFRVTAQAVKDYLAYLAVAERVAASTQNQAFSALLFMCREVLRMELGDLSQRRALIGISPWLSASGDLNVLPHIRIGANSPVRRAAVPWDQKARWRCGSRLAGIPLRSRPTAGMGVATSWRRRPCRCGRCALPLPHPR